MAATTAQVDWKKAYIILIVAFLAFEFTDIVQNRLVGVPSGDHGFHFPKFKIFKERGIGEYPEMGNVPFILLVPPPLIPFMFLSTVVSVEVAYFLTYFLILGIAYLFSRQFMPGKEDYVLLTLLFMPSTIIFFYFGRLLELLSHVAFIILIFYLDGEASIPLSTLLFAIGVTAHIPTGIFYLPFLLMKAAKQGLGGHISAWAITGSIWLAIYLPNIVGTTGWVFSRTENIYSGILVVLESLGFWWVPYLVSLLSVMVFTSLFFLGEGGRRAIPSFFMAISPLLFLFSGVNILRFLPGINQIFITTAIPLYSYLILQQNEKVWKIITASTVIFLLVPFSKVSDYETEIRQLDLVDGNYTITFFPQGSQHLRYLAYNYLSTRGIPTPSCPTWEYTRPEWFFYHPETCGELNVGLKYIIFHKNDQWVKECGDYTETENMIIVKAL